MNNRHERLLFRYSSALERGDFETVAAVLREAEHDPALEEMILGINAVYAAEQSDRFNHTSHQERPMLAPLYQRQTPPSQRLQSLLLVATITLIAVIGMTITTRLPLDRLLNAGQNGSPPAVAQFDPSACAPIQGADDGRIKIYSRPSEDAPFAYDAFTGIYIPGSSISQLDAVETDGQTWYYVRIEGFYRDTMQGWMKAEEYSRHVTCAPLINPTVMADAQPLATFTPTPVPFVGQEPTAVPPEFRLGPSELTATESALLDSGQTPTPTVFVNQPVASFTATLEATGLPPTSTPFPAEAAAFPPTLVPLEGAEQYVLPERCKATTRATAEIRSFPTWDSQVLYSVAPGREFNTGDYAVSVDEQGRRELWYFGAIEDGTGWVLAALLDTSECSPVPNVLPAAPAVAAQATPTLGVDALAAAANFPPEYGCAVETQQVVDLQDAPSYSSPVREQLPAGTPLTILAISRSHEGDWYMVTYRSQAGALMWGMLAAPMLSVPEDCPYYGSESGALPEATVVLPMLLEPTSTALPPATPTPVPAG